jgi:hypothetical protein
LAKGIYDILATLGDKHLFFSTVRNWVSGFRTGYFSTESEEYSGRPTQVTIPENMDVLYSTIPDNRRISFKTIVIS